ncbi:LysR family transcriptional regulator [Mesorhizobium sp. M0751]|uniref:LysR family transcriptional regulator n=1 Tax=unclassified Mesorhizobium TaxID=325217 RepID=UPI00333B8F96
MRSSIQLATLNYALVVEEGSFLRASRRTGIDHTALSRRIRDLEFAVGTRIFHRHARGVGQTPAGERFLGVSAHFPARRRRLSTTVAFRWTRPGGSGCGGFGEVEGQQVVDGCVLGALR